MHDDLKPMNEPSSSSAEPSTLEPGGRRRVTSRIAAIGILFALLAIGIAIFQDEIRTRPPQPETSLAERIATTISEMNDTSSPNSVSRDWVSLTYIAFGFLALIAGVLGFVRGEGHRVSGMAAALGVIAIGWEYVLIGVVIAVVLLLIANLNW